MSRPLYSPHGLAIFLRLLHFLLCLNLNVFFNILGHEVFIDYHEINDITSKKHFLSFVTLNKGDDTSKGKNSLWVWVRYGATYFAEEIFFPIHGGKKKPECERKFKGSFCSFCHFPWSWRLILSGRCLWIARLGCSPPPFLFSSLDSSQAWLNMGPEGLKWAFFLSQD